MTLPRTLVPTADGTSIATHTIDGDEHCIVAIHGFTGSLDDLYPLVQAVRGDRSAILLDVVGHGASDAPESVEPYRMASVVDQVLSIVGPRPIGTVHLIGYSMGGRIALSVAARAPWYFGSVTVLSATAGIEDPVDRAERAEADERLADRIESVGLDTFLDEWLALPLFERFVASRSQAELDDIRRRRTQATPAGLANSLRGTGAGAMPPVWDRLGTLRTPLLAVAGTHDPRYVAHAQRLADTVRDATTATVDAGHVVHSENLPAVTSVVGPFLESCGQHATMPET